MSEFARLEGLSCARTHSSKQARACTGGTVIVRTRGEFVDVEWSSWRPMHLWMTTQVPTYSCDSLQIHFVFNPVAQQDAQY